MLKLLFVLIAVGVVWKFLVGGSSVSLGPGVKAPGEPLQVNFAVPKFTRLGDYELTELASFDLTAKVLARKNYRFGREAELSPVDFALGWGNMSDEQILAHIDISQSGRFYRWRVEHFPIPRQEIQTHSANMHLIPANDYIDASLGRVKAGAIIQLSGSLVNVKSLHDTWYWRTSLTRNDTGGGACELVYVTDIRVLESH